MAGNMMFPVICVVFVSSVGLSFAQLPFMLGPPRPSPRSWGFPNDILGSTGGGPVFRQAPGVLIAGHGPPVSRPFGPVHRGGRPPFPLVTSTPIPTPSAWPNYGPQIQRAKEGGHFEYEVVPRLQKRPTILRASPPRPSLRPVLPTAMPTSLAPNVLQFLARDAFATSTLRPQARTDRPPPPFAPVTRLPPVGHPTYATPSDIDFQEGFRILNDLFKEDAGADITSNLVGGSDASFSGGYFPPLQVASSSRKNNTIAATPRTTENPVVAAVPIRPAKEQGILIAGTPPTTAESSEEEEKKIPLKPKAQDLKMQSSDISFGPPHYQHPQSHASFMFSDPNEPSGQYNLYNTGFESGPPPPFHTVGNSIIPPPLPPSQPPQETRGVHPPAPKLAPKQKSPQGEYNAPPVRNSLQPNYLSGHIPMPMMMLPLSPEQTGNQPAPTSEEVQRALGILARYASKQAQSMQRFQQPNSVYGTPEKQAESQDTPSQQQQQNSAPVPDYLSLEVTAPPPVHSSYSSSSNSHGSSTKEISDSVSISDSQGSSPQPLYGAPEPSYGPPGSGQGGYGGASGGGYSSGGGWSSGGGGTEDLIGAKLTALKSLGGAVTGGIKQVGALKAGILNAGLNVLGGLGNAKSNLANTLKIPIVPTAKQQPKPVYGPPSDKSPAEEYGPPASHYGPPEGGYGYGGGAAGDVVGPISTLVNAAKGVVGGITDTIVAAGKAKVGIGLSKNEFVKNHFVIKGQAFTDTVSKKIANKNEYFQNVLKHVTSIFEAAKAKKKPTGGWRR